ncbi:Sau3AI family type II restriction endonuclease [Aquibacillus rhizosphaerae]|uniref:Sau3AI family type II restriction endonuclease n=1 Tax=Aquibacillus rhizosphaerae TaxID=3051431 RepID=A0ABT7L9C1_9BACI|nr:Sau3AI family type II restriction endonuclease [Aquibacillus sp. LR5S19]MDL4842471.1 Sau3AI family type II restriction endonuclease [Aquibacillus sp. LR5S19]
MIYKTEQELLDKAKQAEGRTFEEIDKSGRIENGKAKGQLGQIIEESFFGYEINSKSEADFTNLGIELKVTPIKKNKNGTLSSKERLVLNIINYHKEVLESFETSSFWRKNKTTLILFYEWIPELVRGDYKVIKSYLHKYPEEDLEIIRQDWEVIVRKIKSGLAHEISEADTNYLAACTKGANRNSLRTQPYSDQMAMQRAYSLKQSYMTAIVRKEIKQEDLIRFTSSKELKKKSLFQLLLDKFDPYKGFTLEQIASRTGLEVNTKSKHFLQELVSGLLGIRGTKLDQIEEFAKANIEIKTVRLEPDSFPKEHMSFKNIDFTEWLKEEWNESWLKNHFEETKFLFVVFHYKESKNENPDRQLYFSGITLWNMPMYQIEGKLKEFWFHVQNLINNGIELESIPQKNRTIVKNNLPKPGSNGLCHIRPKARDGKDKIMLPDGRYITKQAFWLDRTYIAEIIHKNL